MAEAKKCDRCGEFYDLHVDEMKFNGLKLTRETKFIPPIMVKTYDLCTSCATMLKDWLEMKGEKNVSTNTK